MDRCKPVDLSSSHRPVFLPNERLLASQGHVGLYDGLVLLYKWWFYAITTLLNEFFSIQQGKVNPAPGRCLLYHVTSSNIRRCKGSSKNFSTARTWFNPEYRYLCKADKLVRHIFEKCVTSHHTHICRQGS